jgi:hypothetical protein
MSSAKHVPRGWPVLLPRIFVEESERLVAFIQQVFGATGSFQGERPTELRIGDSMILVSEPLQRQPFTAFLYVYVEDTDATYRRALATCRTAIAAPRCATPGATYGRSPPTVAGSLPRNCCAAHTAARHQEARCSRAVVSAVESASA